MPVPPAQSENPWIAAGANAGVPLMPVNPPGPFGQGPGPQQISVPAGDMVKNNIHVKEHLNYLS